MKNDDVISASLDRKATGGSQSLTVEDTGLAAPTARGRLPGGNSNKAGKAPATDAMAATATNVAESAPVVDTLASTAPTTVAAIAGVQPMPIPRGRRSAGNTGACA